LSKTFLLGERVPHRAGVIARDRSWGQRASTDHKISLVRVGRSGGRTRAL
jgi:hypothetical protein